MQFNFVHFQSMMIDGPVVEVQADTTVVPGAEVVEGVIPDLTEEEEEVIVSLFSRMINV